MFILKRDLVSKTQEDQARKWSEYEGYLASMKDSFPRRAYDFATAPWHYDPNNHQCPHDGWVKSVLFQELSSGVRNEVRSLQITLTLLGAYHDGDIVIDYLGVTGYGISSAGNSHGEWLIDEVRVSGSGLVIHEIDFENSHWYIECADMVFCWKPFDVS